MKITVNINKPPTDLRERAPTIEERVTYAIECIECRAPNREAAINFLRRVNNELLKIPHPNEAYLLLIEKIKPVMNEYGTYGIDSAQLEDL